MVCKYMILRKLTFFYTRTHFSCLFYTSFIESFFLKPLHFRAVVRLFVVEFVRDFQSLIFFSDAYTYRSLVARRPLTKLLIRFPRFPTHPTSSSTPWSLLYLKKKRKKSQRTLKMESTTAFFVRFSAISPSIISDSVFGFVFFPRFFLAPRMRVSHCFRYVPISCR